MMITYCECQYAVMSLERVPLTRNVESLTDYYII